jgi:hypothetical protein
VLNLINLNKDSLTANKLPWLGQQRLPRKLAPLKVLMHFHNNRVQFLIGKNSETLPSKPLQLLEEQMIAWQLTLCGIGERRIKRIKHHIIAIAGYLIVLCVSLDPCGQIKFVFSALICFTSNTQACSARQHLRRTSFASGKFEMRLRGQFPHTRRHRHST